MPDNLHLGPIPIHWFGILLALAMLAAGWAASREFARRGLDARLAWDAVVIGCFGGLLGARLWVIIESWPAFLDQPLRYILSGGGLAWYGGFAGGALALTWFFRRRRIPWLTAADAIAPALALGHAIGRIGCQVSGDGDWGSETKLPWGMTYPYAVVGWNYPPGVRVHPTPIYEMLAYLAVFAYLWRARHREEPSGRQFARYLTLAGAARFLVEFVRINPRVLFGLTVAQLVSLGLVAVGAILLAVRRAPLKAPARAPGAPSAASRS
ncbi:MAG: prolipoprotein diacylglyceryl transferase [Candidatus Eisenbacteria bacterium]|uniref:Phosphatidylglycerol--prolipoprotein diacylglyceryl transferase n=1 Tax=Eiseniibacteriota bacterium TaxID=2212470 RepID=A0A538TZV0_UNCEI|nr:MAG: prolipoprotein diacylglyceryl transferase [Candidatus Eisenbacteria bacterium]